MPAVTGHIEKSVRGTLRGLPAELKEGTLAVTALVLARRLDGGLPAREIAGVARELRITMAALEERTPGQRKGDLPDELRARRQRRIHGAAAGSADAEAELGSAGADERGT